MTSSCWVHVITYPYPNLSAGLTNLFLVKEAPGDLDTFHIFSHLRMSSGLSCFIVFKTGGSGLYILSSIFMDAFL